MDPASRGRPPPHRQPGAGLYPHDLREGKHGFTPVSCVGSQVLAVLDHNDAMGYLLDLGALKGRRITLGPFSSPSAAIQTSLF